MDLAFSGIMVMVGVLLVTVLVLGIIFFVKRKYSSRADNLAGNPGNSAGGSIINSRTKYPEVDIFQKRFRVLQFGMVLSLLVTVLAFNWTSFDDVVDVICAIAIVFNVFILIFLE